VSAEQRENLEAILRQSALLIPGTSSVRDLEENLAVSGIELDQQAQDDLAAAA